MPNKLETAIALTEEQRTIVAIQNLYRENERLKAENKRLSNVAEADGPKDALLEKLCRKVAFKSLAGYALENAAKEAKSYEEFAKAIEYGDFGFWGNDEAKEIAKDIAFSRFASYFDEELREAYEKAQKEKR